MKKVLILIVLLVAAGVSQVNAQALKFGHIDIQQLIQVMPERQKALSELEKFGNELEDMLGTMQDELQKMYQEYTEKADSMSELVRQAKAEDIQIKNQRIETYRQQADQQYQTKSQSLMKPIMEKADSAIAEVAKEQGLIYVFDISSKVVLYQSPQSVDILPLVKKKMGIE